MDCFFIGQSYGLNTSQISGPRFCVASDGTLGVRPYCSSCDTKKSSSIEIPLYATPTNVVLQEGPISFTSQQFKGCLLVPRAEHLLPTPIHSAPKQTGVHHSKCGSNVNARI